MRGQSFNLTALVVILISGANWSESAAMKRSICGRICGSSMLLRRGCGGWHRPWVYKCASLSVAAVMLGPVELFAQLRFIILRYVVTFLKFMPPMSKRALLDKNLKWAKIIFYRRLFNLPSYRTDSSLSPSFCTFLSCTWFKIFRSSPDVATASPS